MSAPPSQVRFRKQSQLLELVFGAETYSLRAEYLRVYSPSAEVLGHGNDAPKLQTGKADVTIVRLEPQGNYALKIHFSDGHNTGIYTWAYLAELGAQEAVYWQNYLDRLHAAKQSRHPDENPVKFIEL